MSQENESQDDEAPFRDRAQNFVELHDQVEASVDLLDGLESFLATFQDDLTAVSDQISDLQSRSKIFESRLQGRKRVERPLAQLLTEVGISPALVQLILDTPIAEPWISGIQQFEERLEAIKLRSRVKAARDLSELVEGLRIAAATKIRTFFQVSMHPIRNSISTNMHVLQTSLFLKYAPLFAFLQRQARTVAQELQRAYIGCAKLYYETGLRRYTRSLGYLKASFGRNADVKGIKRISQARTTERPVLIGTVNDQTVPTTFVDMERLGYSKLEGQGTTLAWLSDDKTYVEPVESLFRSIQIVLLDNASAEYMFVVKFFGEHTEMPKSAARSPQISTPTTSTFAFQQLQADPSGLERDVEQDGETVAGTTDKNREKEQRVAMDDIWKEIMDPAVEYCLTFAKTCFEPPPPLIPLLTMIRINEAVLLESQIRDCSPLESIFIGLRLSLWPIFQKEMNSQVESLKKLVDGAGGGYLSRGTVLKDTWIQIIVQRYAALFTAFVALTGEEEEAMLFSNMMRLRQEVSRLIITQAEKLRDQAKSNAYLANTYEILLHNLSASDILILLVSLTSALIRLVHYPRHIPKLKPKSLIGDREKKKHVAEWLWCGGEAALSGR